MTEAVSPVLLTLHDFQTIKVSETSAQDDYRYHEDDDVDNVIVIYYGNDKDDDNNYGDY